MTKILAYLRTSTDKQDLNHQRLEILEYARRTQLHIEDFIAVVYDRLKVQYVKGKTAEKKVNISPLH